MSERRIGPIRSPLLGIACVVVAVTAGAYVRLLDQQGSLPGLEARMVLVLALLIGYATLSGIGALTPSATVRATISAACAGGLLPLGVLALFSIGAPLLAAGAIALYVCVAALRDASDRRVVMQSAGAGVASIVVLVVGFVVTG